jgi:hypothetical protein
MMKVPQFAREMPLAKWERIMRRALVNNSVIDEVIRHVCNWWEHAEAG